MEQGELERDQLLVIRERLADAEDMLEHRDPTDLVEHTTSAVVLAIHFICDEIDRLRELEED